MGTDFYTKNSYGKRQSIHTKALWANGVYNFKRKSLVTRICVNPNCSSEYRVKPADPKKYCCSRCAAIVNNSTRNGSGTKVRPRKTCVICSKPRNRNSSTYCSNICQKTNYYRQYIERWKDGNENGVIGISTKFLSGHIKRYLREKYGEKCSMCGWNKKNHVTGKVPLEVDHIDGNSENNSEENLRLICPNCHALTPSFRNLNKGKGRSWRLEYIRSRA